MRIRLGIVLSLLAGWVVARSAGSPGPAQDAQSHANRGIALLEQFRFDEAAAELEKAVALRPDSVPDRINLAIAYFQQRDMQRARELLEKVEPLDPQNPYIHYNLGLIHKLEGRTEEAVEALEKVLTVDPGDSMTLYYLGTSYAAVGRLDEAAQHLRRCIELQPENESAYFSLGNVLIRQGKIEEGRKALETFQKLKASFPAEASTAGTQYTEMGKYAEAVEAYAQPATSVRSGDAPMSRLRWTEVSSDIGLGLPSLAAPPPYPTTVEASRYGAQFIEKEILPHLGAGLAIRDLDSDGDPELVLLREGVSLVFINEAGRFRRAEKSGLPESGKFVGLTLGDVDNDLDADLYLVGPGPNRLFLNQGKGQFAPAPGEDSAGTAGEDVSVAASFADIDHDGDLDIYVSNYLAPALPPDWSGSDTLRIPTDLPGAPNRLYRNNGNGRFTEIGGESLTDGGRSRSLGALFSDLDDDRDIDFLVVNDAQPVQVFSNDRVGTFTETAGRWGLEAAGQLRGVDSADFDQDGHFDLLLTTEGSGPNLLFRGTAGAGFRPDVGSPPLLPAGVSGRRFGAVFADVDNDTDMDLVLTVNEPGALVAVYENTGEGFRRVSDLTHPNPDVGSARALGVADVDQDGKLDVAVGTDRGRVLLYRNESEGAGGWIRILTRGSGSNKDGIGAKVEVKAGPGRQRREVRTSSGTFSQNDLPLHFGLGPERAADYVRFLWPGGVKQIEMDVPGNQTITVEELNRKGTSCPILYAWDGTTIRFVTDFLGGSAIGNLLAPGRYNVPDTDEVVKIEPFALASRDGSFELRWVNQLEEVMMYDKAALVVVDHPSDVDVFPNERLMPAPPYPESRLYTVRNLRIPARAVDHRGNDVTDLIAERDRRYPSDFQLLPFKGYAEIHSLTLDLGPIVPGEHVVLLLYGWVDYADSSSNLAASQAGVQAVPPYLEVGDGNGHFRPGLPSMGFPAGLPKTMLVDLDRLVGTDSNRVRITTSMRLYWDDIRIGTVAEETSLVTTELAPKRAEIRFLGYPTPFSPDGRAPLLYDYNRAASAELWDAHQGSYTRYGDVRELVERLDDLYVIARHGDELALSFDAESLPTLPLGWKRTFLALADGFGKDMDLNSARPDTVEPLPFHGMSSYPYPPSEAYPDGPTYRRYRTTYNTRRVGR